MNRRAFLCLGVGAALGGCIGNGQPSARLGWIRLVNDRSQGYETEVVVEAADEPIFRDEYRLGTGPDTSTIAIEDPVDGPGRYTIRFLADGQWVHVYPDEYESVSGDCIGVRFALHRQGTRGTSVEPIDDCP